jgi:hypothetical protein
VTDKVVTAPGLSSTLSKSPTFTLDPWFLKSDGKPAPTLKLNVANPFGAPLRFTIEAPQNPALRLVGDAPAGEVPANSSRTIEIPVEVVAGAPARPLELRAGAKVRLNERDISWTSTLRASPVASQTIARAAKPVRFDGSIEDWGALRFGNEGAARGRDGKPTVPSADDASFRFDAAFDDAYLYAAIAVRDDDVTPGVLSGKHDAQDLAILSLDARPMRQSAGNLALPTGLKAGDWIAIMGSPNAQDGEKLFASIIPSIFEVKMKRVPGGYTAEFRVPMAYVQSKHPDGPWTDIRLNMSINDIDPTTKPARGPLSLSWQPDWREQISGTGTMIRK